MSPMEWAVVAAVMFAGAAVQGAVGFGMNLIAAPLLLLVDERLVPGPAIAAAAVMTLLTAVRDRRGLALGEVRWALVGRVPGTVLAVLMLVALSGSALSIVLAALVLMAVGLSAAGLHVRPTTPTLIGAGAVSGFMATVTSIGGPPMAVLYQREQGVRLRATMAGYFFVGTLVSVTALAIAGQFGTTEAILAVGLVPGTVAGFSCSGRLATRLDEGHTRRAVLVVSALAAVSVVVSEVL